MLVLKLHCGTKNHRPGAQSIPKPFTTFKTKPVCYNPGPTEIPNEKNVQLHGKIVVISLDTFDDLAHNFNTLVL